MSVASYSVSSESDRVRDLVYRSVELLDECDWAGWLELCLPAFEYAVVAHSPEIRRDMVWLQHDRDGMQNLVKLLPKHYSDTARLTRHASVYRTTPRSGDSWDVLTSVSIYRTELDGGATSLFAVGKYQDVVAFNGPSPAFAARTLRLETRELGLGTHYPL